MRNPVLWLLVLFLAIPWLAIHNPFALPQPPHNTPSRPPVQPPRSQRIEKIPAPPTGADFPPTPDWERRFWDIANAPDWEQSELLEDVVADIPEDQIQSVLDELRGEPSGAARIFVELLTERWSQTSAADAARWISQLPEGESCQRIFTKVARLWALTNLTAAVNWVQTLPPGGNQTAAELSVAFEAAAQEQTGEALDLVANVPPGADRDNVVDYAVQQWAAEDAAAATTWARQWPDPTLREKMLGQIAVNLAAQNPPAAADWLAMQPADAAIADDTVITIVRYWACLNPADAAAWVGEFPAGPLRDAAVENALDVMRN